MKRILTLLAVVFAFIIMQGTANAQLAGTKTIPGDYATLLAAITDLNANGVGSGGVIFNIDQTYTDTIPVGGYVINIVANPPTASNTVTFQRSGATNPTIYSSQLGSGSVTSTTLGTNGDAFVKLVGTDFVTFNNINFTETYTGATQTLRMEYGILMVRSSATDGCKNVTISGCSINMQRTNIFSSGIASLNINAAGTTTNPTANSGRHENISVQGCTVNNSFNGMYFSGFAASSPYDLFEHFYNIGTTTGNTLTNIGGLGASTTTTNSGIFVANIDSIKINNNSIRVNNGANTTSTSYGIFLSSGTNASADVINNDIRDTSSGTSGQQTAIGCALGGTGTNNTVNISNNTIRDFRYTTATSAVAYYIHVTAGPFKLNITGNTIRDNTLGGVAGGTATGAQNGIFVTTSNTTAGAIYTVYNNSIKNITRTQSSAGAGDQNGISMSGTGQTTNIGRNAIDSLYNATTTGALNGISVTASSTATLNVDSNTISNLSKLAGTTTGILSALIPNATITTENITNNIVSNIFSAASGTNPGSPSGTGLINGYYNFGSGTGTMTMTNNTFTNFTFTGTGVTSTSTSIIAINLINGTSTGINKNVSLNTVSNVTAATGQVVGMFCNYGFTGNIFKNKISNLSSSATLVSPATIGMTFSTSPAASIWNVYNNIIQELKAPTNPGIGVIGMFPNTGTGSKFNMYYNTIYLDAVSSGANFSTYGLHCIAAPLLDMRNNIIINKSTYNGTGNTIAFNRTTAVLTNYSTLSNNNNFYVTPGAQAFLYADGAFGYPTIASMQSAVTPREAASFSENTPFVNTASSPYDLHLSTAIATACESGANPVTSPIAITDDYDGNLRNAGTPDVGADEGNFIANDIFPPSISYTALTNTNSLSDRNLTASITDYTGVDSSASNGPRVYYKKGAFGTYKFGNKISRIGTNFTFTMRADSLGGVTPGDTIMYYVAAQDVVGPYATTNPAGGSGVNPPGTTPPTTPNKYIIISAPLAGTYTVGLTAFNRITGKNLVQQTMTRTVRREVPIEDSENNSKKGDAELTISDKDKKIKTELKDVTETYEVLMENGVPYTSNERAEATPEQLRNLGLSGITDDTRGVYPTITAAANDLSLRGVQGAVTFSLVDNTYPTETYPILINSVVGVSAVNTVTIKPASGITPVVSGSSSAGPMFRIINTNYVTIDGSNTVNGTTRDLSLTNTSTTTPTVIGIGSNGVTPVTNVTVKNCVITNGVTTSTAVTISDATTWGNAGYFSNITIQNNLIQKAYIGVYAIGGTTPQNGSNLSYINNTLTSSGANNIRIVGLYMQGVNGALVSGNEIANTETTSGENKHGIWLATGTINAIVEKNTLHDLKYTGTGGYGPKGISASSGVVDCNNIIRNNMIYNITGDGDSYASNGGVFNPTGIYVYGTVQTGVKVQNNSIYLYGNTVNLAGAFSQGICLDDGSTADVVNNIVVDSLGLLSTTGGGSAAILAELTASQFTALDNNIYISNPSGSGTKAIGKIGSNNYTTLAAWRVATGKDWYSINSSPQFTSTTNLHINTSVATPVERGGQVLAGVTTDYDGDIRDANYPDIGADEGSFIIQDLTPPVISYSLLTSPLSDASKKGIQEEMTDNTNGYRELIATITDNTKLQAALPNAPRMYYKKGVLGTYKFANPTSVAGNNYTFRVLYNDSLGGVASGDSIFYYVAAQDTASNMITNPFGGSGSNPPGTTAPATANFFRVAAAPSGIVLTVPANNATGVSRTASFDWNDLVGAKFYRIQIASDAGFGTILKDTNGILVSQYTIPSGILAAGTQYYWKVDATNEGGEGAFTGAFTFTTLAVPAAPVLVSPANSALNVSLTPLLDWNDVATATTYRVQVASDASFTTILKDTAGLTSSQYQVLGGLLTTSTQYYWRASATNASGQGSFASGFSFTTVPPPPVAPTLVSPADNSINVSVTPNLDWSDVTDVIVSGVTYRLQIATDTAFTALVKDTSGITVSNFTVGSGVLGGSTKYYWRVNGTNAGGTGPFASRFNFTTVPAAPSVPVLVSPSNNATDISVTPLLDWNDVSGAVSYQIQIATDASFTSIIKDTAGITSSQYQVTTALNTSTQYYWRANATNPGGTSAFSSAFNFTTVPNAPITPTLLLPANNAVNVSVNPAFDWSDVTLADFMGGKAGSKEEMTDAFISYRLQISTDSTFATTFKDTAGIGVSQYTLASSSLANNTTYYWRVSATNSGGTGPFTAKFRFTTIVSAPAAPVLVTPANNATGVALAPLFDWNDVSGAASYRIQISTDSAFATSLKDTAGILVSQYQIPGGLLAGNTKYYWKATATNAGGTSPFSTRFAFTTLAAPSSPVLTVPANNAVGVALAPFFDWNDVATATSYRIQISADSSFIPNIKDTSGILVSQYQLPGGLLTNGTQYYWRVSATNAAGTSAFSGRFTFTAVPLPAAVPVLLLPANNASGVSLTPLFDWQDAANASSYRIQISADSNFAPNIKDTSGILTSQYQIPGGLLAINTKYYWRVQSINAAGSSSFSGKFTFTTSPPPPAQVTFNVIPGGLYNTSTGRLNMRDTIKVILVDSANCMKVDSAKGVVDSVNFSTTLNFANAPTGKYYMFVYHRNHIAIATRLTQDVVRGSLVSYNFTTDSLKAFGSNMVKVSTSPVRWAMIPGDANRDGFVDGLDQTVWILQNGFDGYLAGDFNGDGFVDGLDQTAWIFQNGQSYILPCNILDMILVFDPQNPLVPVGPGNNGNNNNNSLNGSQNGSQNTKDVNGRQKNGK